VNEEKVLDRVNHDKLMAAMALRASDKRRLKLIRAFLESGGMEDGLVSPGDEGRPQGSPLSPRLSKLVLGEWERELERRDATAGAQVAGLQLYGRNRAEETYCSKALRRCRRKLRKLTRRSRGISTERRVQDLAPS